MLLAALRRDYGEDAKEELGIFEHTGIKHEQNPDTKEVYTHQNHCAKELNEIAIGGRKDTNPEDPVTEAHHELYRSLLGGVAWLMQSRADIAPFVGSLQRTSHAPRHKHIHRLNRLLRYCKRVSTGMLFKRLKPPMRMVVVAGVAYRSTDGGTDGLALRGYLILVVGAQDSKSLYTCGHCWVLDFVSKKFSTDNRSSFAAELRNQLEAAQAGMLCNSFIEENSNPILIECFGCCETAGIC